MVTTEINIHLLELARTDRLEEIRQLPGAGSRRLVSAISNSIRHQHFKWFKDLPQSDREHLTKAIAVFEETVVGIGSPKVLQNLLAGK